MQLELTPDAPARILGDFAPVSVRHDAQLAWRILDAGPQAMLLAEENGSILVLNTAARVLLQLREMSKAKFSLSEFVSLPGDAGAGLGRIAGTCHEVEFTTAKGEKILCKVTVQCVKNGETPLYALFLSASQVSENAHHEPCESAQRSDALFRQPLVNMHELNHSLEAKIAQRTLALKAEVDERRATETALRESEARFRRLFENTQAGVLLLDGLTLLEINPAGLQIIGVTSADDAVGHSLLEFSAPIQANGLPASEAATRLAERRVAEGSLRFEWICRNKTGVELPIEVFSSSLKIGDRNHAQVILHDISERKRAERELRHSLERERELGNLKSNFISMVSHEYRNPLGIILSSTELLKRYHDRLSATERQEPLTDIETATRRMSAMIDNLLLVGKAEAGKLTINPMPVDLIEICQRVIIETVSSNNPERQIHFEHKGIENNATSDEQVLRLILSNLLTNALKYSPPELVPSLHLSRTGRYAVFVIQDQGIGIPDEDRPALFEAFRRARNVGMVNGTGLGLYIVKHCVELHEGAIDVASAVGKGTTITITLPIFNSLSSEWATQNPA